MQQGRKELIFGLIIISTMCACAQPLSNSDELFSPTAALTFYRTAKELTYVGPGKSEISDEQAKQAMLFLAAAIQLDTQADYILEDMLLLACNDSSKIPGVDIISVPSDPNNPSGTENNRILVNVLLNQYINSRSNLSVCRKAVGYLLSKCDNREQKELVLRQLYNTFKQKNEIMASETAAQLGALAAERADYENATNLYIGAMGHNRYNHQAFDKMTELLGEQVRSATYLEQLRFYLRENPLNLQTALAFAQAARQGELYQVAAEGYQYCMALYRYLYPDQPMPQYIYLPLALCSYNTERNPHDAIQVAEKIRQTGVLDIMLETVAAKAAQKTGDFEKAKKLFNEAEYRALLKTSKDVPVQLAWFYCFAKEDPDKAIEWANKAYAAEPESPTAAALLAYAFTLNGQYDLAQSFIETYQPSQVLNLAKAYIQLSKNEKDPAIETLRSVIASAPESTESQVARKKLKEAKAEYIPPADPIVTKTLLESTFGAQVVPVFLEPDQMVEYQLKIRGDKFYYGQELEASFVITNLSSEDIVVTDNSLLQGNIRIDVVIRGDLNIKIDNLISKRVIPSEAIRPNSSLLVPLQLTTGKLGNILRRYPQANLEIEITAYIDPVRLADGTVGNKLASIKPYVRTIQRPGLELNSQFLRNRMNSLKRRRQSHNTAELFAGLLIEQNIMAGSEPLYRFMYADWMPDILKSGLVYNLTTDDWPSRVYTMSSMIDLPLDFELIEAVSGNLSSEYWPGRMMALYLLEKNRSDGFGNVLDHMAQYDTNKTVRSMAVALGGKVRQEQP